MKTIISEIAKNCQWHKTVNDNYIDQCENNIEKLQKMLPSGSGIDSGCKIDIEKSGSKKVIITFGFHHMNDEGYYFCWTNYIIFCYPTFQGLDLYIKGKDINFIKDYLYDLFDTILNTALD